MESQPTDPKAPFSIESVLERLEACRPNNYQAAANPAQDAAPEAPPPGEPDKPFSMESVLERLQAYRHHPLSSDGQEQSLSIGSLPGTLPGTLPNTLPNKDVSMSGALKNAVWVPEESLPSIDPRNTLLSVPTSLSMNQQFPGMALSDEDEDEVLASAPPSCLKEYVVTLPFVSTRRAAYVDVLCEYNDWVEPFSLALSHKDGRPSQVDINGVSTMFGVLFQFCDLAAEIIPQPSANEDDAAAASLHREIVRKHAMDTNSKFFFLHLLLESLRGSDKKVLVVAKTELALASIKAVVQHHGQHVDGAAVLGDEVPSLAPSEYDLVIGHDGSFVTSKTRQLLLMETSSQPLILNLVIEFAIDHIELHVPHDMEKLQRMNAIIFILGQCRNFWDSPDNDFGASFEDLQILADQFATHLVSGSGEVAYEPRPFPADFFDFYASSSMSQGLSSQPMSPVRSDDGRKRKGAHTEDDSSKRIRLLDELDASGIPIDVKELLHMDEPEDGFGGIKVSVSVAQLQAWHARISDYHEREVAARAIDDPTKEQITRLDAQVKSLESTYDAVQKRYVEAIAARNESDKRATKAQSETKTAKEKIKSLEDRLQAPTQYPDLDAALSKIADLERRLANKEKDNDYTRDAYQRASQELQHARAESDRLEEDNAALRHEITTLKKRDLGVRAMVAQYDRQDVDRVCRIRQLETAHSELLAEMTRIMDRNAQHERMRPQRSCRQSSIPHSPAQKPLKGNSGGTSSAGASRRASPVAANPRVERLKD